MSLRPTEEAYAELQQAYDHFNQRLFDGCLPGALLTFQREKDTFGYFSRNRFVGRKQGQKVDEIAMNPSYFAVVPLVEVLQTLVHEMVHQWQHHFGNPGRGRYHNHEWARKMEDIGLMPSSTGQPGGRKVGDRIADYAVEGGLFLQACEELVRSDFSVSWLDRFPSYKQLVGVADIYSSQIPVEAGGGTAPIRELTEHVTQEIQVQGAGALPPVVVPQEPKMQTRQRYQCACKIRVWGKPGLKITCGECGTGFVPS